MKDLLKVAAILAAVFASTFILMNATGLVTEEGLDSWLRQAADLHPAVLVSLVIVLLVVDLFIAVPTMTTILLAGYLLGPWWGGAASACGLMLLGTTGYGMGRWLGRPALVRFFKGERRLGEIEQAFARNDMLTLFVCQAFPILPELTCTLAGISRMSPRRFALGYAVGVVPFAFIVAYAGAASSIDNPWPAIYTAIGISVTLLGAWSLLSRRARLA